LERPELLSVSSTPAIVIIGNPLDIYSSEPVTKRTSPGSVAGTAVDPTTRTVTVDQPTVDQPLTLTANDLVVRYNSVNQEYIDLQLASDNSSSVTFQNVSRATYPRYRGNLVDAGGNGLSKVYLQQINSLIEIATWKEPNTIVTPRRTAGALCCARH
jgi:hypothetical protein